MAVFKPLQAHEPCKVRIQDYLEWRKDDPTKTRALDIDLYNINMNKLNDRGNVDWAGQMDDMRIRSGHHITRKGKGGQAVTYRHWVFTPDPRDEVTLEKLKEVIQEWVETWLVGCEFGEPGKLGAYQIACVYHDDNARGIRHAHIIANCTDLWTGNKFHADDKEFNAMWAGAQEIAAAHGLTYHVRFGEENEEESSGKAATWGRGAFLTMTERALRKAGRYSWKDDIRSRVEIARSTTTDDTGYMAMLSRLGIERHEHIRALPTGQSKPDYVYTMAANRHWSCSGYRLGNAAYTKEAVEAHREEQLKKGPSEADMAQIRANLEVWAEDVLAGCIDKITTLEIRPDVSLKELAKLLRFNDRHQIGGVDDYDRMLKSRAQALKGKKPLSDERRRKLREEYNDIRLTKSLAEKSGLFSNVAYRPSPKLTKAERLATQGEANKAAAKRRKARDNERTPAPVRPRQVGGPALGGDTASAGYTQTPAKTL